MRTELYHYAHASNGIGLRLIPETEIENNLLKALLKHGEIAWTADGFAIV
jgi:hypothetical protein